MSRLIPGKPLPELSVETLRAERWVLTERRPQRFSLLVFYRGLHCPICRTWIGELDRLVAEFARRGVDVLALSTDDRDRAERSVRDWRLTDTTLGYGLSIELARAWGLYVSSGRGATPAGVEEPAQFCEPAIFLAQPDATLYACTISSMPFARPHFSEVLQAIDYIVDKAYAPRGEA